MLIGEVSRLSGVSARMLRHYDRLGLVTPSERTAGDYRSYAPQDVQQLLYVESLRSLGLSLGEVQQALDDPGFGADELLEQLIADTTERIAREQALLARLRQVQSSGASDWTEVLATVALLRGLQRSDASARQQAALASPPAATSAAVLVQALVAEPDPRVAGTLGWALARVGDEALDALRAAAQTSEPQARRRVVEALAAHSSPQATQLLIEHLDDPDPTVRSRAAVEVGRRGVTDALPELIAMVGEGRRDIEASEALGALARHHDLGDRLTEVITTELALRGASQASRIRLTQTLAELPWPAPERALRDLVDDDQRPVALTAQAILADRARDRSTDRHERT